jgi:hypothetical protein
MCACLIGCWEKRAGLMDYNEEEEGEGYPEPQTTDYEGGVR